jgi:hypothetical protein
MKFFATLVCFSFGVCSGFAALDERGKQLLTRSIRMEHGVNIRGIVRQSISKNTFITVKIQRSADGKLRDTVVAPLRNQGQETIDDKQRMTTFVPDDRIVIVQPSTRNESDYNFRIPLMLKNYSISSERGPKIAGRSTIQVTARSKYEELGAVRFCFDEQNGFALKKDTIDADDNERNEWEVIDISFPKTMDTSLFRFEMYGAANDQTGGNKIQTVTYSAPIKIKGAKDGLALLGFTPSVPSKLPYGFAIQSMTTADSEDWKALTMRITDGLKRLTIYQWKSKGREDIRTGEDRSIDMVGGLKIMVVGDLGKDVREAIIESFQRQARLNFTTSIDGPIGTIRAGIR